MKVGKPTMAEKMVARGIVAVAASLVVAFLVWSPFRVVEMRRLPSRDFWGAGADLAAIIGVEIDIVLALAAVVTVVVLIGSWTYWALTTPAEAKPDPLAWPDGDGF